MGTDRKYTYVGLKAFDNFKDSIQIKRSRDLVLISELRRRVTELAAQVKALEDVMFDPVIPEKVETDSAVTE